MADEIRYTAVTRTGQPVSYHMDPPHPHGLSAAVVNLVRRGLLPVDYPLCIVCQPEGERLAKGL